MLKFNKLLIGVIFIFFSSITFSSLKPAIIGSLMSSSENRVARELERKNEEAIEKQFKILYLYIQTEDMRENARELDMLLSVTEKELLINKFEKKEVIDHLWQYFILKYKDEIPKKTIIIEAFENEDYKKIALIYLSQHKNTFFALFLISFILLLVKSLLKFLRQGKFF